METLIHPTKKHLQYVPETDTLTNLITCRRLPDHGTSDGITTTQLKWETVHQALLPTGYFAARDPVSNTIKLIPTLSSKVSVMELTRNGLPKYRVTLCLGEYDSRVQIDKILQHLKPVIEEASVAIDFAKQMI